jgi:MFS family permease
VTTTSAEAGAGRITARPRRAAVASFVGSALEYYDFFIYGTAAALVFNKIFFPAADPATGTLLALATFGVGYVARPIGAFFMGHIGDKYGRKTILIFTLTLMGAATFLVGCLPTYDQIGVWAPILLVVLRLLQGFSASGEQAGANSLTLEHAPEHRRSFFTSFTLSGTQAGLILASAVWIPISALPQDQLLSWGWRIPFYLGLVVMIVGYLIRRTLDETPAFTEEKEQNAVAKLPLAELFRHNWADVLKVALSSLVSTVSTVFGVFALSFATNTVGVDRSAMLWLSVTAAGVALVSITAWAALADRIGRKKVYIFGVLGSGILMFPYLASVSSGQVPLIFLFGILMSGIVYHAQNGVFPALYGEQFSTQVRLSGMAIGTQFGFAIAGFMPSVAAAITPASRDGWLPAAILTLVCCVVAALATLGMRETYRIPLRELGGTRRPEKRVSSADTERSS